MNPIYLIDSAKSYLKTKKSLRDFDNMSVEDINRLSFLRLKELLDYCWEHVPFYKRLWSSVGVSPDDIKGLSDFEKLPFVDRNDVIAACEDFVPDDYSRSRLSLITTGGTSGMPMKFYIDNYKARGKEVAFVEHINRKYFDCRTLDREVWLRGDRFVDDRRLANRKFWRYSYQRHALSMSSFHITQDNFACYMAKLRDYDPHVIKAYPSSIGALCHLMKREGEKPLKSLRAVICSSENVSEAQRRLVRDALGVEIYSFYGHSEKCVVAFQGKDGKMLFHPLYGYTEFIDNNGRSVSQPGMMAEVVVTGFDHGYFPFIRYRTNDLIEIGTPLGCFERTANRIVGREQDFLYDSLLNKIVFTNSDEPFWEVDGVEAYQYVQDKAGEFTVRLQVSSDYDVKSEATMLKDMGEIFPGFKVAFEYVADIPKTARGKFKYLVQNLKL